MSYKVTKELESEGVQSGFMPVGIHENVELIAIRTEKSPNGNNFIEFKFKSETGEELLHTEWEANDQDAVKLEEKQVKQIRRLKQIVTKFVTDSEYVIDAPDFTTFCLKTINLLGTRYIGKKLRLKVVYNYKNFTSLPNYAKYQFIESMDVPAEKSKIKILALDKMIPSAPNYENNNSASHPFETKQERPINLPTGNDLPF